MDDKRLATAAANGDQEAFALLAQHYRRYIYAIAYRISLNEEDALDIGQNVLLRLARKIGQFKGSGSFRGFLATMTAREAINFTRHRSRQHETTMEPSDIEKIAEKARQRRDTNIEMEDCAK